MNGDRLQLGAAVIERLDERQIRHSGVKDRGFMDSIYFRDPLGFLCELSSYRFEPPAGRTHSEVLLAAHHIRVARGDYNIKEEHLADAIEPDTPETPVASLPDEVLKKLYYKNALRVIPGKT